MCAVPNASRVKIKPHVGIEPTTFCLRSRCSTTKLKWLWWLWIFHTTNYWVNQPTLLAFVPPEGIKWYQGLRTKGVYFPTRSFKFVIFAHQGGLLSNTIIYRWFKAALPISLTPKTIPLPKNRHRGQVKLPKNSRRCTPYSDEKSSWKQRSPLKLHMVFIECLTIYYLYLFFLRFSSLWFKYATKISHVHQSDFAQLSECVCVCVCVLLKKRW